jgi:hypothetical protein
MTILSKIYSNTQLDTGDIPQSILNIEAKTRSNPLPWNGQFSPQLVQALLERYATTNTILLDPFVGSGTVLLEAGRAGIGAFGSEINPAAIMLAQIYAFINVPETMRKEYLKKTHLRLDTAFAEDLPIFQIGETQGFDPGKIKAVLTNMAFSKLELHQQSLLQALIVLLDFYKPEFSTRRVFEVWNRLAKLVDTLPFSVQPIEVFHADARCVPLPDHSVNLVITSPPYINVHNYHQQYRTSTEALGWNLLATAKSEIGSNRKHRGNRYLTVIQYALDIAQVLKELHRLTQTGCRVIFIVGRESTIRGARFFNGEIVAEVAHKALGFNLALRQERVFTNRFGERIFEDILHFTLPADAPKMEFLEQARVVAEDVLKCVYELAPRKSRDDIKEALQVLAEVSPSPLFKPEAAYKGSIQREPNVTIANTAW